MIPTWDEIKNQCLVLSGIARAHQHAGNAKAEIAKAGRDPRVPPLVIAATRGAGQRYTEAIKLRNGFGMMQGKFVVEKIRIRDLATGTRFTFSIKDRKLDVVGNSEPDPLDHTLRNQARSFALREARARDWID